MVEEHAARESDDRRQNGDAKIGDDRFGGRAAAREGPKSVGKTGEREQKAEVIDVISDPVLPDPVSLGDIGDRGIREHEGERHAGHDPLREAENLQEPDRGAADRKEAEKERLIRDVVQRITIRHPRIRLAAVRL